MTYKLVLLRHGQSAWNKTNQFTGWVDVPLTEQGEAEAKRGGELLKEKKEVGDKVLFFGGGQSSCEAAYDLILQGKHPIIVEYAGDLVAAQATCLANTSFLRDAMEYHKVPTYLHSTITEIHDGGVTVKGQDGKTFEVACDNVINGIGFVPAPVGDKGRHVHRVGDCVAIGNLRTVIWRAWDVCMKI